MQLSEFDYRISSDQIAQFPLEERDASRLLVMRRDSGALEHRVFRDITEYLHAGDVLVLNDAKVLPVRLYGKKPSGGRAEITLLKELKKNLWEGLVKGLQEGRILLGSGITAEVTRSNEEVRIRFDLSPATLEVSGDDIRNLLQNIGVMPLPIYIKRESGHSDTRRYQTVFAKNEGAVAAPTAGFHFTKDLLALIRDKGVEIRVITLNVGYGTFQPVNVRDIKDHQMGIETYEISETTADSLNSARSEGRRIIAVGTTVTRALESALDETAAPIKPGTFSTELYIYPGYPFRVIDGLVTNFHQPKSTPMILTSAFAGLKTLKNAYLAAQKEGYRFFSYGDAMLIL
ncbi:MAG: tRNA preQ1(34) S-adenosylmethionine ribosyltransferase-isomerase QueA [Nitrospiraceae bacterium]|nr:MAG: tRNA preQ1(34) S-adenosylmethionine ribosyltransferase-isomerase QueA [Nitrospiraceae bacterium]